MTSRSEAMRYEQADNGNQKPGPGQGPKGPGGPGGPDKMPEPPAPMKFSRGLMSWLLIIMLIITLFVVMNNGSAGRKIDTWQDFLVLVNPENGYVKDNKVAGAPGSRAGADQGRRHRDRVCGRVDLRQHSPEPGLASHVYSSLDAIGVKHDTQAATPFWKQLLITLLPVLIIVGIIWFLISRSVRSAGSGPGGMLGSFGKSKHRHDDQGKRQRDVR